MANIGTKAERDKDPTIEVWVTKYALTTGAFKTEAKLCLGTVPDGTMIEVRRGLTAYYHGKDWHRTEAEALARVKEMIQAEYKKLAKAKVDAIAAQVNAGKLPMCG